MAVGGASKKPKHRTFFPTLLAGEIPEGPGNCQQEEEFIEIAAPKNGVVIALVFGPVRKYSRRIFQSG